MAHDAGRAVGGEGAGSGVGVGAELSLARGQGAERPGDEIYRLLLVKVADQRQLHRAVLEPVGDRGAQLVESERHVGILRLQREARVVAADDAAEGIVERAFGRGLERGEEAVDAAAELRLAFRAVAGIGDKRGEQLQLEL